MKKFLCFAAFLGATFWLGPAAAQSQIKFERFEAYADPADIVVKDVCRPEWPASSLKNSEVGTVDLLLLVNIQGIVTRTKLVSTSGFRELDRATMKGFIGCKFKPILKDGTLVEDWISFRYVWKIE